MITCPKCNTQNQEGAKFCGKCGTALVQAIATTQSVYAGSGRRLIAYIIDLSTIFLFFTIIYGLSLVLPLVKNITKTGLVTEILIYSYFVFSQAFWGQTLGKKVMKIKVVNTQGNKPSVWVFFLREVIGKTVSYFTLLIGFLMILWDKRKQGLHDKIAGTFVVSELSESSPVTTPEKSQKEQKVLILSLLITFFLSIDFLYISFRVWDYFYRIGLSFTPPHTENLGQGGVIFIPLLIFFFIFSKFLVAKFFEDNTRPAVKRIIAIAGIIIIAFGILIRFLPQG